VPPLSTAIFHLLLRLRQWLRQGYPFSPPTQVMNLPISLLIHVNSHLHFLPQNVLLLIIFNLPHLYCKLLVTHPHQPFVQLPPSPPHPSNLALNRAHSMVTRSMNNIYKPKQVNIITKHPLPNTAKPTCVGHALREPH
jgi:hypothetical protein